MDQKKTIMVSDIDYNFIDISTERKEALKRKEEEWKRIVEKYKIRVNSK